MTGRENICLDSIWHDEKRSILSQRHLRRKCVPCNWRWRQVQDGKMRTFKQYNVLFNARTDPWRTTKSTLPSLTVMARRSWRRIHRIKRGFSSREMKTQLSALTRPIVLRVTRTGSSWIWPCLSMNQLTLMSSYYKKRKDFSYVHFYFDCPWKLL